MSIIKKLSYIFDKKQKLQIVWLFIVITIGSALELLGVSVIMPVIDAIMAPDEILENESYLFIYNLLHMTSMKQLILFMLVSMILIYVIKNAFLIYMYMMQYKFIFENQRILADKMMKCYLNQPYLFHVSKNSAELLRNINEDTGNFFGALQAAIKLMTELMVCIVLGIYLFIQDRTITISILFLMGIMLFGFMKIYKSYLFKVGEKNRYYQMSLNKWVQQAFGGIKEAKVLNKEDFFYEKYDEAYRGHAQSEYKYHTLLNVPKPIIEALCVCGLLGAIAIKFFFRGADIDYFVPIISVFAVAAFRLLPSFNRITEYLGTIMYQKSAIDSVYHDLKEIEELNKQKSDQKKCEGQDLYFNKNIILRDISFSYPNSGKKVLQQINLTIDRNTSIAFIGQSGAGKTTLADIVLGILKPESGDTLVDGVSIYSNIDAWHQLIGYIPQTIYLMDDTIRHNIAFGIDEKEIDEERLYKAVEQAQLKELIDGLENGLETEIGERGVRLSGGQRQRIGIARALYRDPQIMILDEATSALDNDTEKAVMEAIEALHGKMTLIIIAHRLSTIKNCDHVYEIKDGRMEIKK